MDAADDTELLILLSDSDDSREHLAAGSDIDIAFQLQMQEAIKVSSSSKPSSSLSSSFQPYFPLNSPSGVFKSEHDRNYVNLVDAELKNMKQNLNRLNHDQPFARQIIDVPDDDLIRTGDFIEKPYGLLPSSNDEVFRVYFRGLVSDELVMNVKMPFAGIGVAICDGSGCCLFESRKSFFVGGIEGEDEVVELKALIESLDSAVSIGIACRLISVSCEYLSSFLPNPFHVSNSFSGEVSSTTSQRVKEVGSLIEQV